MSSEYGSAGQMEDIWGQRCAVHDVAMRPDGTCILCERGKPRSTNPGSRSANPGRTSSRPGPASYPPGPASYPPDPASYPPGATSYQPGPTSYQAGPASYRPGPRPSQPAYTATDDLARPSQRIQPYERPPNHLGTAMRGILLMLSIAFLWLWFSDPQTLHALFK